MLAEPASGDLSYTGTFSADMLADGMTAEDLRTALRFDTENNL